MKELQQSLICKLTLWIIITACIYLIIYDLTMNFNASLNISLPLSITFIVIFDFIKMIYEEYTIKNSKM